MKKLKIKSFRGAYYINPEKELISYVSEYNIKQKDIQQIYADKYCHFLAYWITIK